MSLMVDTADFQLHVGDVREVLAGLPDESVHCVVTSPPYWGLRNYGVDGQLGLEPTPELYVESMVRVFREVKRVLRRDGTCWLNIGDSYAGSWGAQSRPDGNDAKSTLGGASLLSARQMGQTHTGSLKNTPGLKPKDLCGIPWRLAFALQADGWYLRSEIIWAKPNPMPESVTDRPTKSHEQVFLLTRSPRYFYDADAVRESYQDGPGLTGGAYSPPGQSPHGNARGPDGRRATRVVGQDGSEQHRDGERWPNPSGRNIRSVWTIATEPYPDAHFATFPQALVEPCVKAGTSERGCCRVCGAPWERETETSYEKSPVHGAGSVVGRHYETGANNFDGAGMPRLNKRVETTGWKRGCSCNELRTEMSGPFNQSPVPCIVLDPFMGSGTTALVARNLGRRAIGIELSESYAALAARRNAQQTIFTEATA